GEGEELCGAVSGGTGRGESLAFTSVASATTIPPGGAERRNMLLSDRELGETAGLANSRAARPRGDGSGLPDLSSLTSFPPF
ncbi:MAG: hypothetical protein ABEI99_10680, partial [Halobaculum sp.]